MPKTHPIKQVRGCYRSAFANLGDWEFIERRTGLASKIIRNNPFLVADLDLAATAEAAHSAAVEQDDQKLRQLTSEALALVDKSLLAARESTPESEGKEACDKHPTYDATYIKFLADDELALMCERCWTEELGTKPALEAVARAYRLLPVKIG